MSARLAGSLVVTALVALAISGPRVGAAVHAAPALVKTAPAHILVNARGMTLYVFTLDKHGKSACSGACATYWPPLLVPKGTAVTARMDGVSGTFGVTARGDGTRQLTYDGAPLYTFIKDKRPGDMSGQGTQGGTWWVVVVNTTTASTGTGTGAAPTATETPSSSAGTTGAPTATATPSTGGYGY